MDIVIYGLINSAILMLITLGFALAYSVSRVPNFAHGAVYIIAGLFTWIFLNMLHLPYAVAVLFAVVTGGFIGIALYQFVLVRIRGLELSEVIATYAIGLAILELFRWAGFKGMTYSLPAFLEGSVKVFGVPIDLHRVVILGVSGGMLLALWLFTHYTRTGLALRAIAQDEWAALTLGIDSDRAAMLSLGIGCTVAAVAAAAILPLGTIAVEAGYQVLVFALAVCIVGGLGSWGGTILAAFVLGYAQVLSMKYLGAHFQMIVALGIIIATLVFKPSGLFGRQKELEERV